MSMFCYQTDVIVCTTPHFPRLCGAVAEKLLERSGEEREIRHDCKKKGQLEIGEVFESCAGRLQCKLLYHVLMEPMWTASGQKVVKNDVTITGNDNEKNKLFTKTNACFNYLLLIYEVIHVVSNVLDSTLFEKSFCVSNCAGQRIYFITEYLI